MSDQDNDGLATLNLDALKGRLDRLSKKDAELFKLRFIDDCPYPMIASHLDISEALARKRVQLLRAKLKLLQNN
ncbi:sigma-70 region 4 domain-containing protein [Chromobacterium vaccinii]|nr:sigma-70 region 4 domain-containing protein [Chromobacterium vaccinii]